MGKTSKTAVNTEKVLTKSEAAAVLRVCQRTVDRLIAKKLLKRVKVTRKVLIPATAIDEFLRQTTA